VLILDKRVVKRYYGQVFLRSLPTKRICRLPSKRLFLEMKAFFEAGG